MNSKSMTDFMKPTIITAQQYGTKTTVEVDHSDLSLDEVMDAFQTLIIGMGYHENSFKNWVIERADEYRETDAEDLKEKLEAWKFEDDDNELRHHNSFWQGYEASKKDSEGYENREELENDFFGQYDSDEKRMDIIGQNGNEGLHYDTDMGADEDSYRATQEDEDEFSNDGGFDGKPHFEWGDIPEDEDLFEGDEWKANENLKAANERYKREVKKKMNSKKRNNKN
jgi:hypothetical protein